MTSSNKDNNSQGKWRITSMEVWDSEYYDMEVPAYVEIKNDDSGYFQFGLVQGELYGKIGHYPSGDRFEFTWEGGDENDPASGSGWLQLTGNDRADGEIRIHRGDNSAMTLRRMSLVNKKK